MGAITWLKEHNPHYIDIKVNENWHSSQCGNELSLVLLDNNRQNSEHVVDTCTVSLEEHTNT